MLLVLVVIPLTKGVVGVFTFLQQIFQERSRGWRLRRGVRVLAWFKQVANHKPKLSQVQSECTLSVISIRPFVHDWWTICQTSIQSVFLSELYPGQLRQVLLYWGRCYRPSHLSVPIQPHVTHREPPTHFWQSLEASFMLCRMSEANNTWSNSIPKEEVFWFRPTKHFWWGLTMIRISWQ